MMMKQDHTQVGRRWSVPFPKSPRHRNGYAAANFARRFEPFEAPRTLRVPNVLGDLNDMAAPGRVVFGVAGQECHLTPVADPDDPELFFIFRDLTSGAKAGVEVGWGCRGPVGLCLQLM